MAKACKLLSSEQKCVVTELYMKGVNRMKEQDCLA